jgi:hypothetical protein
MEINCGSRANDGMNDATFTYARQNENILERNCQNVNILNAHRSRYDVFSFFPQIILLTQINRFFSLFTLPVKYISEQVTECGSDILSWFLLLKQNGSKS